MQDLNDLYYFVQVVDHGGFAPAGRALGVPKSKLSRRIALLEERLGVRLIQRSTRRFVVTELGQTYYTHARAMLVEAEAAEDAIRRAQTEPRGVVRMSCPTTLLEARAGPMLAAFLQACPQIELHLDATNRRVDVIGEGLDLAIRVRPPPLEDSDLVLRILGESRQCLVASPTLLAAMGTPATPAELMRLPSMELGVPQNQHVWDLYGPDGAHVAIHHQPRLVTRGMSALRDAALNGVGIVQLPRLVTGDDLQRGDLVQVLPGWSPRPEIVHALYASRRGMLPAVRALIDDLTRRFAALDEV
jgi:DNA-binding transcriptional LysR family regulator